MSLPKPEYRLKSANLIVRLMLKHDEVFRLPATSQGVRVVAGLAWLTVSGEDIFLNSGEKLHLLIRKDVVLVSALGNVPLILEVLGDSAKSSPGMLTIHQQGWPGTA